MAREAWKLGYTKAEEYQRIKSVKGVRGERLPTGRALQSGELRALLQACATDRSPAGVRDAALLALLYAAGLRRDELAALDFADWVPDDAALKVRRGKGNKQRQLYVTGGAIAALNDWLTIRGDAPGRIFLSINKGGRIALKGMMAQAVYNILQKRAREAGLTDVSPHDFRRTFTGDLLDEDVDISTVQKLLGHANVQTTVRYDRRGERAKKKAVGELYVPYVERESI